MKTFYAVIIAVVMLIGTLSFALVSAQNGQEKMKDKENGSKFLNKGMMKGPMNGKAMYAHEFMASLNDTDADDSFEELSMASNHMRLGFPTITTGNGWAISSENGSMLSLMLLEQEFKKTTNSTDNSTEVRTLGRLMLPSVGQYKLVLTDSDNDTLKFNVYNVKEKIDFNDLDSGSIGTLSLDKDSEFSNLIVWSGKLVLDGKTWNVDLATNVATFKSKANALQGQKVGFWKKLMFWKK